MRQESPSQAVSLLRKAVPLMIKLKIAPTPYNYGIWYTYVSNRNKKLNHMMDSTIQKLGSLPDFVSKELFQEFILDEDLKVNHGQINQLDSMIGTIETSSEKMNQELEALNSSLEKTKKALKSHNRMENIKKIIHYLEVDSKKASDQTHLFQESLQEVQHQITSLKREIDQAKKSSDTDPVTGLLNNRGLERHLFSWINTAEDDLSIILIDIDDLSRINKKYGKKVGTAIIRFLGQFLQSKNIENSVTARLEGGTFAILVCEESLSFNSQLAEQIRLQVERQVIRTKRTQEPLSTLTVSIGIATLVGQELGEHLLERAKDNLIHAKDKGGNQVSIN
ncbi:GGDEF domain-containing protein [Marinomonas sp. 2405UD68-3]|uniref:GGDEF domain-containing protein n=1 Tax=Marinomonas sp. 2405UD68-3 TaxID=3391835 RepID=UPI0039C95699